MSARHERQIEHRRIRRSVWQQSRQWIEEISEVPA